MCTVIILFVCKIVFKTDVLFLYVESRLQQGLWYYVTKKKKNDEWDRWEKAIIPGFTSYM